MHVGYSIRVVPDETSEGAPCYLAYHPELDGCMSHGMTVEEALSSLDEARDLFLNTLREIGEPIPQPAPNETVVVWRNWSAEKFSVPAIVSPAEFQSTTEQ